VPEVLVVGGSGGLGLAIARKYAEQGDSVVVTSRSKTGADEAAALVGGSTRGLAVDLAQPATIESALAEITSVDHLVVTADLHQYGARRISTAHAGSIRRTPHQHDLHAVQQAAVASEQPRRREAVRR
jgi:NAD(P)-dependent dehydrogenase (short-subunit alcohol dehydrogenase family)